MTERLRAGARRSLHEEIVPVCVMKGALLRAWSANQVDILDRRQNVVSGCVLTMFNEFWSVATMGLRQL